jgi:hypothetical protein
LPRSIRGLAMTPSWPWASAATECRPFPHDSVRELHLGKVLSSPPSLIAKVHCNLSLHFVLSPTAFPSSHLAHSRWSSLDPNQDTAGKNPCAPQGGRALAAGFAQDRLRRPAPRERYGRSLGQLHL